MTTALTIRPKQKLWTVARFPSGDWSTGGRPTDIEYSESETWQVWASSREEAKKKAQGLRSRAQRKLRASEKKQGATP